MDLVFQISSWYAIDIIDEDVDQDSSEEQYKYLIKVFGVTASGESVAINLLNYTPFFFIKLPKSLSYANLTMLNEHLQKQLGSSLVSTDTFEKKDFWGFTNQEKFKFMRITLNNLAAMRKAARLFTRDIRGIKYKLYESNIDPFLRMIHIRNISPSGWVTIKAQDLSDSQILPTYCKINKECKWTKIGPPIKSIDKIAPLLVASFDIECTSTGGDFPDAKKKYKKLAYEISEYIRINSANKTMSKSQLKDEIVNAYDYETQGQFSKLNTLYKIKLEEIHKILNRHIDDIINISEVKYKNKEESFALVDKLDNILPLLKGDPIIQIGTSYMRIGSNIIDKCVITLNTCDQIPDIQVIACETEQELILKWCEFLCEIDPDIMIGYNIFGFDMEYMFDRAEELGIANEFLKIGRIIGHSSEFVRKTLSSSALGDNLLKYVEMEGRVIIDLMKTVQRDHKLDSYKLDNVAKVFLNGKVKNGKLMNLIGINEQDYVAITYNDETTIKHKIICLENQILEPPLLESAIKWGLAKDDITPKQIFEYQAGTSAQRAIVAKYCVQDCSLCLYLLNKLQILANNIGMSNVCYVPLSYIFMRGQGIKIFSLVAKQCREDGFLIPVLAKPQDVADDEDSSFEGAIVLEPKQGIYTTHPIAVLDYASLYPSSMISENLSQDCYVIDKIYDNIPGVKYLDISYDVYDTDKKKIGIKTCRFAQNTRGMMPNILMKLLQQRKSTRKKIIWSKVILKDAIAHIGDYKSETRTLIDANGDKHIFEESEILEVKEAYDDFEKAVLDGLQNAYKVTANSLYGQCGARTSQIYMQEIAACTTATGRAMILKAKAFIEENYQEHGPDIIYGDSVTGDTPLLIKYPNGNIDIKTIDSLTDEWISYKYFKSWDNSRHEKQQGFIDAKIWAGNTWADIKRVIRHKTNKKLYRVNTYQGCIDVTEDHSLIDIDGKEIKPTDCIIGQTEIMHTFPTEFPVSCTDILNETIDNKIDYLLKTLNIKDNFKLTFDSKLEAQKIYYLLKSVGINNINVTTKNNYYFLYSNPVINDNIIKTITELESITDCQYVYDIETSEGIFHGGIGMINLKNTDSLFLKYEKHTDIKTCMDLSHEISHAFKKTLKAPHDLEFDKIFYPFILFSKKRYCANKYEENDTDFCQASMGIAIKRRDNAQIVKIIYGGVLDIILNQKDIPESIRFLKENLQLLIDGKFSLKDLVISKSLKSEYKDPSKIAHKALADRIGIREPGNKPQTNDRIPYVYIENNKKNILQGERIEHPDFIVSNNLKPDYAYYIEHQLVKPICQLYALVLEKLPGYNKGDYYKNMYPKILADKKGDIKKAKERLQDLKEQEVEKLMFTPLLSRLESKKAGNASITDYFKPKI